MASCSSAVHSFSSSLSHLLRGHRSRPLSDHFRPSSFSWERPACFICSPGPSCLTYLTGLPYLCPIGTACLSQSSGPVWPACFTSPYSVAHLTYWIGSTRFSCSIGPAYLVWYIVMVQSTCLIVLLWFSCSLSLVWVLLYPLALALFACVSW